MALRGRLGRLFTHLWHGHGMVRRVLSDEALTRIEAAISAGESRHGAEVRFVIESSLEPAQILRRVTPRDRALVLFSSLGVWDTEHNNGVLLYVLVADRAVEIIADRAAAKAVPAAAWEDVCSTMAGACRAGPMSEAALAAIASIHRLVEPHFPPGPGNPDELPNRPVIL